MKKLVILLGLSLALLSCTDNERARSWGGTEEVKLPQNCVFINSTWKESQLWVTVKDTSTNQFYMYEKSSLGYLEGKIIFE
jgi:hypothetical protein